MTRTQPIMRGGASAFLRLSRLADLSSGDRAALLAFLEGERHAPVRRELISEAHPGLVDAFAVSQALEEGYLLSQIVRLGRLNAQDRIADLVLELHERLDQAGLDVRNGFSFPLTQEMLADALGLTSVHVNRMLQNLRREGDLETRAGYIRIPDARALAVKIGRVPLQVTAAR